MTTESSYGKVMTFLGTGTSKTHCKQCGIETNLERHVCPAAPRQPEMFHNQYDPMSPVDCVRCGGVYVPMKGHACSALVNPDIARNAEAAKYALEAIEQEKAEKKRKLEEWKVYVESTKKTPQERKELSERIWEQRLDSEFNYPTATERKAHEQHLAELDRQISEQAHG